MSGLFERKPNGDGNLQWRFLSLLEGRTAHTKAFMGDTRTFVLCNIKRVPKAGAYCKRPSYYM